MISESLEGVETTNSIVIRHYFVSETFWKESFKVSQTFGEGTPKEIVKLNLLYF